MKQHTDKYRENIMSIGRQIDEIITYTLDGQEHILDASMLITVSPIINGEILKSVMKQLNFESTELIPKGTIINYSLGVLVDMGLTVKDIHTMKVKRLNELPTKMQSANLKGFEYINFGNFIIKDEPIYNADTQSYSYVCYDKMLYSMVEYSNLNVSYPITIRDYINAICNKLGLIFKDINTNFANYNKEIPSNLYDNKYTFRDVLDELAEVTASTICINEQTDELEIRYITETNDVINEEFLKDVNVEFKEKYGPVNSIVLSRSAESDNVYLRDEDSVAQNGLCEIKIIDNQIMNFNDRSDYLPAILEKLNGLEYYLNDFNSTGITWYELCDRYTIQIEDKYYSCVLLNDEINVNQGLEEIIHTDMPEKTETDYTKADKTDRKINQTYIIVDKQNQKIESLVTNVTAQNNKISRVEQTVDELNSKISDIADITTSQESNTGKLIFENINESQPIHIEIRATGENISYLYPFDLLYPADNLYIKLRTLRFTNTTTNEVFNYELPQDLLYYDNENYDTYVMDYDSQNVYVNKKCKYNTSTGQVELLPEEQIIQFSFPQINLTDGNYKVEVLKYDNTPYVCYLFARLMVQNIYTTQFATKAELSSEISQTVQRINLSVNAKFSNYSTTTEMNSAITIKANEINSEVSKKVGKTEIISRINQSAEAITINANKISLSGKKINLTSDNISISSNNFRVDKNGNMSCSNANISGKITATSGSFNDCTISNCTIRNSCTVPASTVSGTLATNNIPNISASKITSGTMSANRISGGRLSASEVSAITVSGDIVAVNSTSGHFEIGNSTGKDYKLIVQQEGKYWRRLTFEGGILVKIESSW